MRTIKDSSELGHGKKVVIVPCVSFSFNLLLSVGFLGGSNGKESAAMWKAWVQSLGWEDLLEEGMANPFWYACLENPHGQRSLVGYSPWRCTESDMTE